MPDSLRQPNLLCCGGTWIVPGDLLKTEYFSAIVYIIMIKAL